MPPLLLLALGCGGPPEGRDHLVPGSAVGPVSRVADREVWVERVGNGPFTVVHARDAMGTRELLRTGAADRVVLSPDGSWVAFVYAPSGLAAIGVVPFDGGPPVQLTNAGLRGKHAPGVAPEGFVPVPADDGDLSFVGDRLEWTTPAGKMSVGLPVLR
jgi:hypothetical protein